MPLKLLSLILKLRPSHVYVAKVKSILTNNHFCVWLEAYEVHVSEVLPHCKKV